MIANVNRLREMAEDVIAGFDAAAVIDLNAQNRAGRKLHWYHGGRLAGQRDDSCEQREGASLQVAEPRPFHVWSNVWSKMHRVLGNSGLPRPELTRRRYRYSRLI